MSKFTYKIAVLILLGLLALPAQSYGEDITKKLENRGVFYSQESYHLLHVQPSRNMYLCEVDDDCMKIATSCANSSCYNDTINKVFFDTYENDRNQLCTDRGYIGAVERCRAFNTTLFCEGGLCGMRLSTREDWERKLLKNETEKEK